MTYERDFYAVNPDRTITLYGWLEERDNNIDGFEHDLMPRHTFVSGDWPEFNDLEEPLVDWAAQWQQYNEDMHYEDVAGFLATFFDGEPGEHLPLNEVNEDTPEGNYWCKFEEE